MLSPHQIERKLELSLRRAGDLYSHALRKNAAPGQTKMARSGPVKAGPIALAPDSNWADAFKTIAHACLHQVVANEPALLRNDSEAVHQMRVGIRRLRAAISLFKDMLAGRQTETVKAELKWLAGELGPARELDVFMKRAVRDAESSGGNGPGLSAVIADFHKRRADAMERAAQAVASARFRRLLLDTAAWIEAGDWNRRSIAAAERTRRTTPAAAGELRRRRKKIRKQGARLAALDPAQRHRLRIQAKKLRYATEFFAGAFPGKKLRRRRERFVARLKDLQDALGELNDIVVHERLAKQEIGPPNGGQEHPTRAPKAFAAGRLSGRESARFAAVMKDAERAYGRFAKAKAFWK